VKFFEVIINAYANELIARNDLPDHLYTLGSFMKVKKQIS